MSPAMQYSQYSRRLSASVEGLGEGRIIQSTALLPSGLLMRAAFGRVRLRGWDQIQ